jgi:LysM repeat protein
MIEALLVVGLSFFNPQVPTDSLGTETINGKVVVVHRVDEKETLYSLSRRYGTTVDDILLLNPEAKDGLEIGEILKVPFNKKSTVTSNTVTSGGVHVVKEKETLYSISRMYDVSIDDVKEWNNMTSNTLSLGQELIIKKMNTQPVTTAKPTVTPVMTIQKGVHEVAAKETMFSISKQYAVSIDDLRKWNNLDGNELRVGQLIFVAPPKNEGEVLTSPSPAVVVAAPVVKEDTSLSPVSATPPARTNQPTTSSTITISENVKDGDEVIQAGLAELIEGTEGNRKYLALHRTAPVGTILKVRNEMNNREVFVRVIGKLPDTALTSKLIIKVSRSAYDRLGAIDPRFRVEVTYYK